jgi:inhibitor of KinA sporulation pathway (predicted exonuclease)
MEFIIYDLEATCWNGYESTKQQEIIEIGALRINAYGEVIDEFNRFVRPALHPQLSAYCVQLTGINQAQVDRAHPFPHVIEDFKNWIDVYENHYFLMSWGAKDVEFLKQDCALHKLSPGWILRYHDLKEQYHSIKNSKYKTGLSKTLENEGFQFSGVHHRALDDAKNLARLFIRYLDEWQY